ncbi:aldose epimerase family protein [Streptomyces barringtoniae]|uniref:aldose epimerase family protein n=1 Tax=Streptomyces barringtoniae TaxID=2892029 RepID=UPI001E404F46|nr:aldose 1-epimerase [Streptomyces barringtoniae]MCC5476980.1 aldose 1-epimerase [Streptomyces barringtoniae]
MSNEDITLTAGNAEVHVSPANGGRISSLKVNALELLRQGPRYGCFPMVPWCGRIRDGRFLDGGTVRQMPLNSPPHAIHGTTRDGAWRTARVSENEAVITYDLVDPWPHPGRVTHVVTLAEDGLTLTMSVEARDDSFPAQIGWHPWFNRTLAGEDGAVGEDVTVRFEPAWQEERGDDHLPTGNRIDPKPGPWDDCFGMPGGVDVSLTWPGQLELKVTSREEWVVVYDEQAEAVCVEPQTGPPNGLNTLPHLVTPLEPLEASTTWSWRRP